MLVLYRAILKRLPVHIELAINFHSLPHIYCTLLVQILQKVGKFISICCCQKAIILGVNDYEDVDAY